jgi:hypothetical protein
MTIATQTQVIGTTLLTAALTSAALWANGIVPAPRVAACLDKQVESPAVQARLSAPVAAAESCGGDHAPVRPTPSTTTEKE